MITQESTTNNTEREWGQDQIQSEQTNERGKRHENTTRGNSETKRRKETKRNEKTRATERGNVKVSVRKQPRKSDGAGEGTDRYGRHRNNVQVKSMGKILSGQPHGGWKNDPGAEVGDKICTTKKMQCVNRPSATQLQCEGS